MTPLERVDAALSRVLDPCSITAGQPLSLTEMGLVRSRAVERVGPDGPERVAVTIGVTGPGCTFVGLLVDLAQRELAAELGPATRVDVTVDPAAVWTEADMTGAARAALTARRRRTVVQLGLRPRMWEEIPA